MPERRAKSGKYNMLLKKVLANETLPVRLYAELFRFSFVWDVDTSQTKRKHYFNLTETPESVNMTSSSIN